MIAGHIKFAPVFFYTITAKDFLFYCVFNVSELIAVMEKHATIVFYKGAGLEKNCCKEV